MVARLGGDEFAILQRSRPSQHAAAAALAARLIETIGSVFELDGRQVAIGASIGVAVAPDGEVSVGELLRHADLALYKVKGSGRNAFRVFDEGLDSETNNRSQLEADLRAGHRRRRAGAALPADRVVRRREPCAAWRRWCAGRTRPAAC